ncbi:calmin isoform X2 [Ascaphus truei]|uniref:calmin isoform X2 n=1 Tax=Ascaphus truei TaxID=8439 RepID=UPI003F5AB904
MDYRKGRAVERENVQKRTFTRWINLHLEKCNPSLEVKDLFVDIQDGKILMALLEVLTGQSLLHEHKSSSHRIFRLNNIAKALKFLEDSNVKLVSIDAAEIADGNPSLVLGLIWNIILFLKIKELTGNLNRMSSSSSLHSLPSGTESDTSHPSTASAEKSMSVSIKDQRKAIKALLHWVQRRTRKYGVAVQNFASSWTSGLAFLAVIKSIDAGLVDMKQALERSARENLEDAFSIAHKHLGIPTLLEPEDVMVESPDEQSIMTYVTQFLEHFPALDARETAAENEELPVETTYVHYKDGPREEEGKIITLNKIENDDVIIKLEKTPLTPPQMYYTEEPVKEDCTPTVHENVNNRASPSLEYKPILLKEEENTTEMPNSSSQVQTSPDVSEASGESPAKASTNRDENTEERNIPCIDGSPCLSNVKATLNHHDSSDENSHVCAPDMPPKNGINKRLHDTHNINSHSSSAEDLSTNSNKEPVQLFHESNDVFFQTQEEYLPGEDVVKPSALYDEGDLLSPVEIGEEDNVYKYVMHLQESQPENPLVSGYPKQMAVFQAYRGSTASRDDKAEHEGPLGGSKSDGSGLGIPTSKTLPYTSTLPLPEEEDTESMGSAKVSVIPHDLFYYPHYSVPIAEVLDAFTETCSDGSKRKKVVSRSLPENKGEELELKSGREDLQSSPEMTNNGVSLAKPDEYEFVKKDPVLNVKYQQIGSEMSKHSVHPTSNSLSSQISAYDIQAIDLAANDPDYSANPQGIEREKMSLKHPEPSRKRTNGSVTRKAEAEEEDFQVIEDAVCRAAADPEDENLKDLLFSRATQSDTSVYLRKDEYTSDQMNFGAFLEQNVDGDRNRDAEIRKRGFEDTSPPESADAGSNAFPIANSFPEMFYIAVLLWALVYCVLILPELDFSKVTFFSNN